MLIAYFDDSGGADLEVLTVAASVASTAGWAHFEEKWKRTCAEYKIPSFRMANFENRQGHFKNDWTNDKRHEFIAALVSIITETQEIGVSSSVILADLEQVFSIPKRDRKSLGLAFRLAFQSCLQDLADFFPLEQGERIACVWDEDPPFHGVGVSENFLSLKRAKGWEDIFGSISLVPRREHVPLEAADMLAYENFKHVTNQFLVGSRRPMRKSFKALLQSGRLIQGYTNRTTLERLSERDRRGGKNWLSQDRYEFPFYHDKLHGGEDAT